MAKLIKTLLLLGLLAIFYSAPAHAATTTFPAASCNPSDIASAISSATAAGSGNTVTIPAGTCTWTSPLNVNVSTCVSIVGQSSVASRNSDGNPASFNDNTVIIDNVNHASTSDYTILLNFNGNSGSNNQVCDRFSGVTLKAGNGGTSNNGAVILSGTSPQVRLDNLHFYLLQQLELSMNGQMFGVIDDSMFDQADLGLRSLATGWNASSPGTGSGQGDGSWNDATTLGSNRYMYIERNTFNSTSTGNNPTPSNDCLSGGRFVERYNTFTGGGALQTHPTGHAGDDRCCRSFEIYGNDGVPDTVSSAPEFNFYFLSSGTGVIWGNTASGYQNFVTIHSMLYDTNTYQQSAPPNGWGYCGTAASGSNSAWNLSTGSGYVCLDQPGRGQGDLLSGVFPNKCDQTTGCSTYNGTWANDALEPVYEWMDNWTTASGYPGQFWNNSFDTSVFANNHDYYYWCNSSSQSGCTTFDGTQGVGSGTLAARPSTCTTGVAYWATDQGSWNQSGSGSQGQLYKCTATNTWTLFYTPYTYPHPLISGTGASTGPGAPTNLSGTVVD